MPRWKYKAYYKGDYRDYTSMLLEDFDRYPEHANAANYLAFDHSNALKEWISSLDGRNVQLTGSPAPFDSYLKRTRTDVEIKDMVIDPKVYREEVVDLYRFFSQRTCTSMEQVREMFPGFYYVFDQDLFKRTDFAVLKKLEGYKSTSRKGMYQKKVGDDIFINLYRKPSYSVRAGVEGYIFPDVSIIIGSEELFFFDSLDVRDLLFLPGNSFVFFYIESHELVYSGQQIVGANRKYDQPVVYHDETAQTYIISNIVEKLEAYNKYILLTAELSAHYFRVFEKWLIKRFVNAPV